MGIKGQVVQRACLFNLLPTTRRGGSLKIDCLPCHFSSNDEEDEASNAPLLVHAFVLWGGVRTEYLITREGAEGRL